MDRTLPEQRSENSYLTVKIPAMAQCVCRKIENIKLGFSFAYSNPTAHYPVSITLQYGRKQGMTEESLIMICCTAVVALHFTQSFKNLCTVCLSVIRRTWKYFSSLLVLIYFELKNVRLNTGLVIIFATNVFEVFIVQALNFLQFDNVATSHFTLLGKICEMAFVHFLRL